MKGLWVGLGLLAVVILVLLLGFGSYVGAHNAMVQKNEDVNNAYSQVDVEQQRRLDLIPNLVASVKGYVKEEETVLTNIANARAGVIAAGSDRSASIKANSALDVAISPLLRLQEAYPNLKSNEQFRTLTDELAGTRESHRRGAAAATTARSRLITSISGSFRTASGRIWRASIAATSTSKAIRPTARPPLSTSASNDVCWSCESTRAAGSKEQVRPGKEAAMSATERTSVSALMGAPVIDADGKTFGRVSEFAVAPLVDAGRVKGLVVKRANAGRGAKPSLVAIADLKRDSAGNLQLLQGANTSAMTAADDYLLLERDLLDQQIIDVHGHKVVRVNDVDMVWETVTPEGHDGLKKSSN